MAAAAAFLRRAVGLGGDPERWAGRVLAAAEASFQAGAFDDAMRLLNTVDPAGPDEFQRARVELVRARVSFAADFGGDAAALLLGAAIRLQQFDIQLACETYLSAWSAAIAAGQREVIDAICHALASLELASPAPDPLRLLLKGLTLLETDGRVAATPTLQRAAEALAGISLDEMLRWGWVAPGAAALVWDAEGELYLSKRQVQLIRDAGALAALSLPLSGLGIALARVGDLRGAAGAVAEGQLVAAATGSHIGPYAQMRLLSLQGRTADASALIAATIVQAETEGQLNAASWAHWSAAVLFNGFGRYDEAALAAGRAAANRVDPWIRMWAVPELIESASRTGKTELAHDAFGQLVAMTAPAHTNFALGMEARCEALLSEGSAAESSYQEAIDRLGRTKVRPEAARAHLLYGEWLRREGRRLEAREQLRIAHEFFGDIGMEAFGERARRELLATGEKVRRRIPETRDQLTPQEAQIARLAAEGQPSSSIGEQLFLSPRTVDWHLGKVFGKLGVASRRELRAALADLPASPHS
jgi:DNA-binding CsgD family transcriptional regulator